MTVAKKGRFTVQVVVTTEIARCVVAASLEDALALGRSWAPGDVYEAKGDVNEHKIEVTSLWKDNGGL